MNVVKSRKTSASPLPKILVMANIDTSHKISVEFTSEVP